MNNPPKVPPGIRLTALFILRTPTFLGKRRILGMIRRLFFRRTTLFPWRMRNGTLVALSTDDLFQSYGVGPHCFRRGNWEQHIERYITNHVGSGCVALDIGANIGYFTAVLSLKTGPGGRVYAFEPVPVTLEHLKLTIRANGFGNVTLMEGALGEESKQVTITYSPEVLGNASLRDRKHSPNARRSEVTMRTLDSLYECGLIRKCDFIKMDVEGYELNVLRGGMRYLRDSCPDILFEYNPGITEGGIAGLGLLAATILQIDDRYLFHRISESGEASPVKLDSLKVADDDYVDLLAAIPKGVL
jgi:FkbM family methyltransferase